MSDFDQRPSSSPGSKRSPTDSRPAWRVVNVDLSVFAWDGRGLSVLALVSTRREYDHLFSIYVPIAVGVFVVDLLAAVVVAVVVSSSAPELAARWTRKWIEGGYALLLAASSRSCCT